MEKEKKIAARQIAISAQRKGKVLADRKKAFTVSLKYFSWGSGVVLSLLPILVVEIDKWLLVTDKTVAQRCEDFVADFYNGGSFLWLAVTMLAMALLSLCLHGYKKSIKGKKQFWCIVLVVVCVLALVYAIHMYLTNIAYPLPESRIKIISWVVFVLFSVVSWVITFRFSNEV